jgi:glycosyltransferase involved in cell wall biosynthesis
MRVLLQNRPRNLPWKGGDQVQEDATAQWLEALGVEVHRSADLDPDLSGYDVVHLFNLIGDWTLHQFRNARRHGAPVVVSTIYNPHQYGLTSFVQQLEMVRGSQRLLPNSHAEQRKLEADFGCRTPCTVVPNGIDPQDLPEPDFAAYAERDIALFVGRIDERKRPLELVRAWNNLRLSGQVPLVLVGHPFLRPYYEKVRVEAARVRGASIAFAGELLPEQVREYYRRARVFVLPSRLETPGLANLEAAACGCALVVGDCPDVRETFGELARYCDGASPADIAAKVLAAWQAPPDPRLAALVRERHTWEAAARATLAAYEAVLETHGVSRG